MAGRPRKPTAIKALQGTLQKCRTNMLEPKPVKELNTIAPPQFLSESAKGIYIFGLEQAPAGVLSNMDFGVYTEWVIMYDNLIKITELVNTSGVVCEGKDGYRRVNDLIAEQRRIIQILHNLQNALGFTPASRSKVQSFDQKSAQSDNPFGEF